MGDAELEGRTIGERRRRESLEVIEWTQWRLELEPAARQALRDHVEKRRARMPLSSAGTPVCSIRVDKERRKLTTSTSTYDNKLPVLVQIQRKAKLLVTLENERISPQNPWQMSTLVAGLPCPRRSNKVKLCEHSTRIPR